MPTAWDQTGWRFRNDDGTEATATWKKALNTALLLTVNADQVLRVRFAVTETGTTTGNLTAYLRYNKNAAGWVQVTGATANVKAVAGGNGINDATTTQQISSPTTFGAGAVDAADGITNASANVAQNAVTEMEFCIQITAADVATGDVIQLEVYRSSTNALQAYTAGAAELTVQKALSIAPSGGSVAVSGAAAVVGTGIPPSAGSVGVAGASPVVGAEILTGSGSLAIIGQQAFVLNIPGGGGGENTTITPSCGDLAITGQQPGVSSDPYAYAIWTYAARCLVNGTPGTPASELDLIAKAIWEYAARTLTRQTPVDRTPTAGSLAITGYQPSVSSTSGLSITPGAGSLAITGSTALIGGVTEIVPGSGSVSITGAAPVLTTNYLITPNAGTVSLTGSTPSLLTNYLRSPSAGTIGVTGGLPLLGTGIAPTAGTANLTGFTAAIGTLGAITPFAGSIGITGNTPIFAWGVMTGAGTVSLNGIAPGVSMGYVRTPGSGSVGIAGYGAGLVLNTSMMPNAGSILFTGFAPPSGGSGYSITPTDGRLSLSGLAAEVRASLTPSAGSVTFTGSVPLFGNVLIPGTGSILLTGYGPVFGTVDMYITSKSAASDGIIRSTWEGDTVTASGDRIVRRGGVG